MPLRYVYALIVVVFTVIIYLECTVPPRDEKDKKLWDNGTCNTCGNAWEFSNASYYRGDNVYYFRCKKCNDVIDLKSKVFTNSN